MASKQKETDGISLRTINIILIVEALILSGVIFYFTDQLSGNSRHLTDVSEQQIELRKSARELMDASDYLTEMVQRFTIGGDMQYLEAYFDEAFLAHHREEAVTRMASGNSSDAALEKLKDALNDSVELMDREYYAMRLVVEAKGFATYPYKLSSVLLSEADRALSPEEKMHRAAEMVFDEAYYTQKESIQRNMRASLDELEKMAHDENEASLKALRDKLTFVRIVILLQAVGTLLLVFLTSRLSIHPILNAVERIREDSRIPVVGANEFRYLARTYNKMYEVYKNSLNRLNFKASHDELTGAFNRSGYELLLSGIDLQDTYMILFDIDNFKAINDTYGHETGDKVLVKLVQVLKNNFRADDYICRIGGDEFVVFMIHAAATQEEQIAEKIELINKELETTDDGLPTVSISVGITHGSEVSGSEQLFEKADEAMYRSKRKGKRTYTFTKQ